jgi:hypothetical protein
LSPSPAARRVELTAASTVALGVLCLLFAALEVTIPILLGRLEEAGAADDPAFRAVQEAFVSGAGSSAAWNGAFGVALVAIGIGVARRSRWSHGAMTAAAWGSIVALLAVAKPSLAPVAALVGAGRGATALVWGGGAFLLAAQVALVVWFLRFWRSDEVRRLFR